MSGSARLTFDVGASPPPAAGDVLRMQQPSVAESLSGVADVAVQAPLTVYVSAATPSDPYYAQANVYLAYLYLEVEHDLPLPATASLGLLRRLPDGTVTDLGQGLQDGAAVVDAFAPTDMPLEYVALAYSATGLSSQTAMRHVLDAHGATLINFGDGLRDVLRVVRDKSKPVTITPEVRLTPMQGREYPVATFGDGTTHTGSVSGSLSREDGTLDALYGLTRHRGLAVLRREGERGIAVAVTRYALSEGLNPRKVKATIDWSKAGHDGLAL
jgi:hypothetical protein